MPYPASARNSPNSAAKPSAKSNPVSKRPRADKRHTTLNSWGMRISTTRFWRVFLTAGVRRRCRKVSAHPAGVTIA